MAEQNDIKSMLPERTPVWKRYTLTITEAAEYYHRKSYHFVRNIRVWVVH
ncbi:MAG: hypothetical protein IJJ13_08005 [Lachnospiraceae bacterium]|nr:hypothetical protein [Lachnospiraceae bacterium]